MKGTTTLRNIKQTLGLRSDQWASLITKSGDHWAVRLDTSQFKRLRENRPDVLTGLAVKKKGKHARIRVPKS